MSGKTYASADWHGHNRAWELAQEYLSYDDTLYYLGDATDRGLGVNKDGGWSMLKEMLEDIRVVYVAGNHDIMLADALTRPNNYNAVNLCYMNGGGPTFEAAMQDPNYMDVVHVIRKLPRYATYTRPNGEIVYMSHSGSTAIYDDYDLIWNREEYLDRFKPEGYDYVVFGHTNPRHIIHDIVDVNNFLTPDRQRPVPTWKSGPFWVNDYRCCLDNCTIRTNQVTFLNLDTFDAENFKVA